MGYRSDVYLYCHKNVYDTMRKKALESDNIYAKDIVFNPDEYSILDNGDLLVKWLYCKWYRNYKDVGFIMDSLLDIILQDESNGIEEYYFKLIEVGEDGATDETCNDDDYESYTCDFYPYTVVNMPFKTINTCEVPRFQSLIKTRLRKSIIKTK